MSETYKPDQVRLRPVDTTRRTGPSDAGAFGGGVGGALLNAGRALGQTADVSTQIADMQADTRTREADIAFSTRVREELRGEQGLYRNQGTAFTDNAPAYRERIESYARELQQGAKTPLERRMLADTIGRRLESTRSEIQGEIIRQTEFAHKATAAARVSNTIDDLSSVPYDSPAYAENRGILRAAVDDALDAQGLHDPATRAASWRKAMDDVSTAQAARMILDKDFAKAGAYIQGQLLRGEIDPTKAFQFQEKLQDLADEDAIQHALEGSPGNAPVVLDRVTPELSAAVRYQETRGSPTAVSPKGARGPMQVMTATGPEAAKLAGVAWQPERLGGSSPEDIAYGQKLGDAYLNAQLKKYGGNVTLALAAYNAGPGAVDKWLKTIGDPRTGKVSDTQFASAIPFGETKDYVAKITARLGGTTFAPLPQKVRTVEEVETWAQQFADPKTRAKARAGAFAKMNQNRAAENQRQSDAWDQVQPYLQQDIPWTSIPKRVWVNLDPQHQTALIEAQRRGTNRVTSPEALDGVYSLIEQSPEAFKTMDLLKLAPDFSPSDFEQLRRMQHDAISGQGEWKRTPAQFSAVTRMAPNVAPPSMLKPGAKVELAQFKSRWFQAVQAKQATQKEPLTDDEVSEIGTRLTAETVTGSGFFGPKTKPLYEFATDAEKNKAEGLQFVPAAERSKVTEFLTRRNGRAPSNGQVLETWRTLKATGDL